MILKNNIEKETEINNAKCPRCFKDINISDEKCKFCGYDLSEHYLKEDEITEEDIEGNEEDVDEDNYDDEDIEEEDVIICDRCGMQVFDDETYCSHCGNEIEREEDEEYDVEYITCFCCGKEVDASTVRCPKCGANLDHLDTSDTRNPYTRKYIMSDGSQAEGNAWQIWGILALLFGGGIFLFSLIEYDPGSIIASLIVAGIGILLLLIGSYREHKGKEIVRKQNDVIRRNDPKFKTKEDKIDNWDKAKSKINSIKNKIIPQSTPKSSMSEELRALKSLLDDGIITQEEFEKKKKDILNNK